MAGEKNLAALLKNMKPHHNEGDYVFCTVEDLNVVDLKKNISIFKEEEGYTIILKKELADELHLGYSFTAACITLTIHSSLEAVGLTAAFATALSKENISCNVVAAFYHDHIFVDKKDITTSMEVLNRFSLP